MDDMLAKINPTKTKAWQGLKAHYRLMKNSQMKDMFLADPARFTKYSLRFEDILLDYSKNIMDGETLRLLSALAAEAHLPEAIEKMFSGDKINETEDRAVLHTALRNLGGATVCLEGRGVKR